MTSPIHPTYQLCPLDESSAGPIDLPPMPSFRIGRSTRCEVRVDDPSISREHASFGWREGTLLLTDLESRHGTFLNGIRLEPGAPQPMQTGDVIRLGVHSFRLDGRGGAGSTLMATTTERGMETRLERVSAADSHTLASRQLHLLLEGAGELQVASDEPALYESILRLALRGTDFQRAAILRSTDSEAAVEVLASRERSRRAETAQAFSRSLLQEASGGHTARLRDDTIADYGQSIHALGITSAVCAPIQLDGSAIAFLYLDSRTGEMGPAEDASGFCSTLGRLAGLALSNLKRTGLQLRQARLERDLETARASQKLMLPETSGVVGDARYAFHSNPGHVVAGDFFDIFTIDDTRIGLCFGDICGHGVGAAVVMTAVLARLRSALEFHQDLLHAAQDVNTYLAHRSTSGLFATIWLGAIDRRQGTLSFVDAGHGHWLMRHDDGWKPPASLPHGPPIGIHAQFKYDQTTLAISSPTRLLLYSDGLFEQANAEGQRFGHDRVTAALTATEDCAADINALFTALREFTGPSGFADDTTAASIEIGA